MKRLPWDLGSVPIVLLACASLGLMDAWAQETPRFFREDWAESPPSLPITQTHVADSELTLHLYGPGGDLVKKSHHEEPPLDPYYVWSGRCDGTWALTLSREGAAVDLAGPNAEIQWRSRPSGLRAIRVVLKQSDGTWLVSEQADTLRGAWHTKTFPVSRLRWHQLDIDRITEGVRVEDPDLGRVTEVGFTDLMRGGGQPGLVPHRLDRGMGAGGEPS